MVQDCCITVLSILYLVLPGTRANGKTTCSLYGRKQVSCIIVYITLKILKFPLISIIGPSDRDTNETALFANHPQRNLKREYVMN